MASRTPPVALNRPRGDFPSDAPPPYTPFETEAGAGVEEGDGETKQYTRVKVEIVRLLRYTCQFHERPPTLVFSCRLFIGPIKCGYAIYDTHRPPAHAPQCAYE